jgi:hypothetical protein
MHLRTPPSSPHPVTALPKAGGGWAGHPAFAVVGILEGGGGGGGEGGGGGRGEGLTNAEDFGR